MRHRWYEWVPAAALALIVLVGSGYCVAVTNTGTPDIASPTVVISQATPQPYEPVSVRPFVFLTEGPYHVGDTISLEDGICNNSGDTLQGTTVVGWIEQGRDRISTRNIVLQPRPDSAGAAPVQPLPIPIAPGCLGTMPVTSPLCANISVTPGECLSLLPPGRWKLYVNITVLGPQGGQMQRISDLSPEIEVDP